MAIKDGSWSPTTPTNNRARLRYEFTQTPSSVGSGTGSVSLRLRVWYQSRFSVIWNNAPYSVSGSWSSNGTFNINHGSSGGQTVAYSGTITVNTSYTGTVSRNFTASVTGISVTPNIPSVSATHRVAKRPPQAANRPTWGATTHEEERRIKISWSVSATTARPITNFTVQRWRNSTDKWTTVATPGASARSWTDTNAPLNDRVRYRVRANGPGGNSSYRQGGQISTRPAAPSNVKATKQASGDIRVTYTDNAANTGLARTFLIEGNDGSGWAEIGTSSTTTFDHVNPNPATPWRYRVRARISSQVTWTSSYSGESGTVQLLAKPNPPTPREPTSGVYDLQEDVLFKWRHNPVDTTEQTAWELRWGNLGTGWQTLSGTTEDEVQVALSAAGVASTIEWQVRTKGQHPDWSGWSPVQAFHVSERPFATINTPEPGALTESRMAVTVGYHSTEDRPWAATQGELVQGGRVIETASWGGTSGYTFNTALENETEYTLRVRVRDGDGLWSWWDEVTVTTEFPSPVRFTPSAEWVRETGAVDLSVGETLDAAAQYAWEGEPDDSTSTRTTADGTVTNLATNPNMVRTSGDVAVWENIYPNAPGDPDGWLLETHSVEPNVEVEGTLGIRFTRESTSDLVLASGELPLTNANVATRLRLAGPAGRPLRMFYLYGGLTTDRVEVTLQGENTPVTVNYPAAAVANNRPKIVFSMPIADGWSVGDTLLVWNIQAQTMGVAGGTITGPYFNETFSPDPDLTPHSRLGGGSQLEGKRVADLGSSSNQPIQSEQYAEDGEYSLVTKWIKSSTASSIAWGARLQNVPLEPGKTYTVIATCVIPEGYDDSRDGVYTSGVSRGIHFQSTGSRPYVQAPAEPGVYELRITITSDATNARAHLGGGGVPGGPNVHWIGPVTIVEEEDYAGPPFSGSDQPRVDADSIDYQRRDPGGEWITVAEGVDTDTHVTDPIPNLAGPEYRIVSRTELPSSATGPSVELDAMGGRVPVYLNAGDGFETVAALYDNTTLSRSRERGKTRHRRAGRTRPVTKWGEHRNHEYTLSATINRHSPGATAWEVEDMEDIPTVACYRDPLGHKHFVTIDSVSTDVERDGRWTVSIPMTAEDYDERALARVPVEDEEEEG